MSASAHETVDPSRARRLSATPHLVLLPGGRRSGRPQPVARAATVEPTALPLRLTAVGRRVVTVLVATAVALLGVGLAGQLATAGAVPRPVTVRPGDTLSGIAARELPDLPIADGVVEIQLTSGLSSSQVHTGQTLLVPTP